MTTNKPEVVAYHINKENPEHRGVSHDADRLLNDGEGQQS